MTHKGYFANNYDVKFDVYNAVYLTKYKSKVKKVKLSL
jgi:hypothetical protein